MKGFPLDYTPDIPDLFLMVRIALRDYERAQEFEDKGLELLSVFEGATKLKLVLSGTTLGVADQEPLYINFWKMRDETFAGEIPEGASPLDIRETAAFGGTRDLLPAMSVVHDIAKYGPVDDLIVEETQDLVSAFLTDSTLAPELPSEGAPYYVLAEYSVSSGKAGTFAFDLRAHLGNFEKTNSWDCVTVCFPMTGPLHRYFQIFRIKDDPDPELALQNVGKVLQSVRWAKPKDFFLLRPTLYDQPAVPIADAVSSKRPKTRAAARLSQIQAAEDRS